MYTIFDNDSGATLGEITDDQLAFLTDQLEEESAEDRDYYIMGLTVDIMESRGADPALITLLRNAMGSADGIEIRWQQA